MNGTELRSNLASLATHFQGVQPLSWSYFSAIPHRDVNLYCYVGHSLLNFIDPSGNQAESPLQFNLSVESGSTVNSGNYGRKNSGNYGRFLTSSNLLAKVKHYTSPSSQRLSRLGRLRVSSLVEIELATAQAIRGAGQLDVLPLMQGAIDDGPSQLGVVQDPPPLT